MQKIGVWVCVMVATASAMTGCAAGRAADRTATRIETTVQTVPAEAMSDLSAGMTRRDVARLMESDGLHQFSLLQDGRTHICVSHFLDSGDPKKSLGQEFYFLFIDGKLEKVVLPVSLEGRPEGQAWDQASVQAMEQVLSGRNLLASGLQDKVAAEGEYHRFVLPSAAKIVLMRAPPISRIDHFRNRMLAKKYHGERIELGASPSDVEAVLGQPRYNRVISSTETVRVYGQEGNLKVKPQYQYSWVAVVYQDERAVRVYSHDFFDGKWKRS